MPTILRNKTATIEIDFNVNLQHIVTKGSFDVTILDGTDGVAVVKYVHLLFRRAGQIKDNIQLDWRDVNPAVESAEELRDLILLWNITPGVITDTSGNALPLNYDADSEKYNLPVHVDTLSDKVSEDSNGSLKVSSQVVDEYGNVQRILGDNIFKGTITTIPVEHHEIHCGDSYEATYVGELANGASIDILIVVPNEGLTETEPGLQQEKKQYHFKGSVNVESEATIEFFEGVTVSANGDEIPVFNRNRNAAAYVDFLAIYQGATTTNTGTRIEVQKIGAGKFSGGEAGRQDEWILKDNTSYILRIKNDTTSANYYAIKFDYYVHPGI